MHGTPRTSLSLAEGGNAVKVKRHYATPHIRDTRARRGTVRVFSRRSRTRLMQWLCSLPRDLVGRGLLFVTLTYPRAYPGDWHVWKAQLRAWFERLRRRLPAAGATWKLEPQKRGAPHFHLLVVGAPFMAKDWLSRSWYEVVNSGDQRHLRAGTQVQLAHSHRGVLAYAAKYTAKANELPADWQDGVGRYWGVFGRAHFGVSLVWFWLTEREFWTVERLFRRLVAAREPARPRAPPRYLPGGTWAVLADTHALRILAWLDTLTQPALGVTYASGGASHP